MPDILIRNFEMPKTCGVCPLFRDDFNDYCMAARSIFLSSSIKPDWCPLVPLPEGHGRLIDGDALFEKMYRLSDNEGAHKDSRVDDALILRDSACYLIEDAPTIVPAEGGTDECSEN